MLSLYMYINCIFQGVVTYMFRVEAFATGIKIECQCQCIKRSKPFWGAGQGIKVISKLLKINDQERVAAM